MGQREGERRGGGGGWKRGREREERERGRGEGESGGYSIQYCGLTALQPLHIMKLSICSGNHYPVDVPTTVFSYSRVVP